MRWTSHLPAPGWYWARNPDGWGPEPVKVSANFPGEFFIVGQMDPINPKRWGVWQFWSTPLTPPQE